jgi:hypothetical protein
MTCSLAVVKAPIRPGRDASRSNTLTHRPFPYFSISFVEAIKPRRNSLSSAQDNVSAFAADLFAKANLEIEDLFLLESLQTAYLPGWIPEREFAAVLHAHPGIDRFLRKKCPPVGSFLDQIAGQYGSSASEKELSDSKRKVLVTIADLLVYNRCPKVYDSLEFHSWDFGEITSVTKLDGKTVIDAGAGTGRVALEAATSARLVFAVEPVARLREFIRDRAATMSLPNVFVMDGFLHSIPFPNDFADVLITSHALGWRLEDELRECERVVKEGGCIIHCAGGHRETLESPDWGYSFSLYQEPDGPKTKHWKKAGRLP